MDNNLTTVTAESDIAARTPDIIAAEIRTLTGSVLSGILEIGRRFTEAKKLLPHGDFGNWVRGETGYSMSTANNFMRLYSEYGADQGSLFGTSANSQTIGNLSYSKALALLEVPAEEREDFAQEVGAEGLSVRELKAAIREREEQLTEAQNTAEGYRLKLELEQSERADDAREAEARVAKAEEKLNAMIERAYTTTKILDSKNSKILELQAQLEALQNAPREVAVETVIDEEAIKAAAQKAREAAEKELKAKIAKAEKERDKAVKDKNEAERKLEAATLEKDSAEDTAKKAQEIANQQLADLRKKLALADSPEKVSFKFWFAQGQECVNKMLECVENMAGSGKSEDAKKLAQALTTFLEAASDAVKELMGREKDGT